MEGRPLVAKVLLSCGQSAEVLSGLRDGPAVKTHHDATHRLVAMADVKVDLVGDLGTFGSLGCLAEEKEGDGEDQENGDNKTRHCEHLDSQLRGN